MEYRRQKADANDSMSAKRDNDDSKLEASYTVLGRTDDKNDVKLKISKLEAYSRQLCLNLIDLQKNREDITKKTLALTEELENSRNKLDADDISSETDIHFLLHAKKSGCCTICRGYETLEGASPDRSVKEESKDLCEALRVASIDELDGADCCCCVCWENRICDYICDSRNPSETTLLGLSSQNSLHPSFCLCDNGGAPYIGEFYRICDCEQDDGAEERFRGGVDRVAAIRGYTDDERACIFEIGRDRGAEASRLSRADHDLRDPLSAWSSWDRGSESVERLDITSIKDKDDDEKPLICSPCEEQEGPEEDDTAVELTKAMHETKGEGGKGEKTMGGTNEIWNNESIASRRRIEDDSGEKSNVLDPPNLYRPLEAPKTISRRTKADKGTVEDKTFSRDLFMGLSVLFLVFLSCAPRYFTLASLFYCPKNISNFIKRFFDPIGTEFFASAHRYAEPIGIFGQITAGACANFVALHLALVAVAFVSRSLLKFLWSLIKRLYSCPHILFVSLARASLSKFNKSIKRSLRKLFFSAKSQYHFFSYFLCLALGYFVGKVSRISDKWFLGRISGASASDRFVVSEIR